MKIGAKCRVAFLGTAMLAFGLSAWGQTAGKTTEQTGHGASATAEDHATPVELAAAGPAPVMAPEPVVEASPIEPGPAITTPKPVEKTAETSRNKKIWYSLIVMNHGAAAFDAWSTRNSIQHGAKEVNPLLKPFASSNAMYVANQVVPFGMDYLGRRMMRSQNPVIRKLWWLPQTASAACALAAGIHNMGVNP